MQNLDIIVLTSVLSGLFIYFAVSIVKELNNVSKPDYKPEEESGPRANMVKFVGNLFDDKIKKMTPQERVVFYKHVKRTIADMETDGVYFPEEVKDELEKQRQSLTCEYSGLPSMLVYLDEKK